MQPGKGSANRPGRSVRRLAEQFGVADSTYRICLT